MDLDPHEFQELHDAEEIETDACRIWRHHHAGLFPEIATHLDFLAGRWQDCGCLACSYLYYVLWLGHERVIRLERERDKDQALLDDYETP